MTDDDKKPTIIDLKKVRDARSGKKSDSSKPAVDVEGPTPEQMAAAGLKGDMGFKAAWERAQPLIREANRKAFNEHALYYFAIASVILMFFTIVAAKIFLGI